MSFRSDVGIAIRPDSVNKFIDSLSSSKHWTDLKPTSNNGGALLYVLPDIKWNTFYSDVKELHEILGDLSFDTFYVVEACHEYPELDESFGQYYDNPFCLSLERRVSLYYQEE